MGNFARGSGGGLDHRYGGGEVIEQKPDIVAVIEGAGVELRRRGRDFWGRCPFHEERTPSFKINPERQQYYCFSCHEHGDAVDFVQKLHHVDFKGALAILGVRRGRKPKPDHAAEERRARIAAFDAWRRDRYQQLCRESIGLHELRLAIKKRLPQDERIAWMYAETMSRLPGIEHELDVLLSGDKESILELFAAEV